MANRNPRFRFNLQKVNDHLYKVWDGSKMVKQFDNKDDAQDYIDDLVEDARMWAHFD